MPKKPLQYETRRDAIAAYAASRVIKLLANGLRPIFYCQFLLQPGKRFALKKQIVSTQIRTISARRGVTAKRKIPKIIWQTNYTEKVTMPVKATWIFNLLLSPGYNYYLHTDEEQKEYVKKFFPGRPFKLFSSLTVGAARSDLWRLLVLYREGGVYIDMDAHLVWPLDRIISPDMSEVFLRYKSGEATNYFMASEPENPTIWAMIMEALNRIENLDSNSVYKLTGPDVVHEVLKKRSHTWRSYQYTCLQGNFSNKFFQYVDKPGGHWLKEQRLRRVVDREIN